MTRELIVITAYISVSAGDLSTGEDMNNLTVKSCTGLREVRNCQLGRACHISIFGLSNQNTFRLTASIGSPHVGTLLLV